MTDKIPDHQRAVIFQGGGALGAYEVGYYEALYEKFVKQKEYVHPFDTIVGTSIGAINGSLLVSHYMKNKTWEGSVEHLKDFWNHLSSFANFSDGFSEMWDSWRKFFPNAPSKETARRHFSVNEFIYRGVPNVFSVPKLRFDEEFFGLGNPWFQSSNQGLKESLEKFIDFPIATEYEKNEPRLLLVAVDIQESLPVVFDSYKKSDGKRKTIYGQTKSENGKPKGGFVIDYDGIEVEHILASSCVPMNYDYTKINAKEINGSDTNNGKQVTRYLWDGGILHNTPIQPLIYSYKVFWDDYIGIEKQRKAVLNWDENQPSIPELRTYIVDMWAKITKDVPANYDETKSRYFEIMFSDKTEFEEKIMSIINDYVGMTKSLINLAKEKGSTNSEIEKILMTPIESEFRVGFKRSNIDLIRGKFPIKITRISRKDDSDDIADQAFDFSPKTIVSLIKDGYDDAKKSLSQF